MTVTAAQLLAADRANQLQMLDFQQQKSDHDQQTILRSKVIESGTKKTAHIGGIADESMRMVYNKAPR